MFLVIHQSIQNIEKNKKTYVYTYICRENLINRNVANMIRIQGYFIIFNSVTLIDKDIIHRDNENVDNLSQESWVRLLAGSFFHSVRILQGCRKMGAKNSQTISIDSIMCQKFRKKKILHPMLHIQNTL